LSQSRIGRNSWQFLGTPSDFVEFRKSVPIPEFRTGIGHMHRVVSDSCSTVCERNSGNHFPFRNTGNRLHFPYSVPESVPTLTHMHRVVFESCSIVCERNSGTELQEWTQSAIGRNSWEFLGIPCHSGIPGISSNSAIPSDSGIPHRNRSKASPTCIVLCSKVSPQYKDAIPVRNSGN